MSVDQLAVRTGIRMSVLKSKLTGNGVLDIEELDAVANVLGVPIARLVGNE
jgi:transcriptional regulator with XRE-family HTH domain